MQGGCGGGGVGHLLGALLGAAFAVQHIGACHFVVAHAHQAQFHLVLYVFNMEGAAAWTRAHQGADDLLGQGVHVFAHAGRGCALGAMDGERGLHDGHGDLVGLKGDYGAVAANDLVARQRVGAGGIGQMAAQHRGGRRCRRQGGKGLHDFLLLSVFLSKKLAFSGARRREQARGRKLRKHYIWCVAGAQATTGSVPSPDFTFWHAQCVRS